MKVRYRPDDCDDLDETYVPVNNVMAQMYVN